MKIADLTKECPREDCRIVDCGGASTCMGWTPYYDKLGNLVGNDPNIHTHMWRCGTCGKEWRSTTQYGKTEIAVTNA